MKVAIDNGDKLYRQIGWYAIDGSDKPMKDENGKWLSGGFEGNKYRNQMSGPQLAVVEKIVAGDFRITIEDDGKVSFVVL